MTNKLRSSLDSAASILASAFVADCQCGHTTRVRCDGLRRAKNCPDDVSFVKAAIRHDADAIQAGLSWAGAGLNMRNVLKTSYQLTYLANETMHKLRMRAQRNPDVRAAVSEMFGRG